MKETSGTTRHAPTPPTAPRERSNEPVSGPGLALEALPSWLLSDLTDSRRSVCLDRCGVGRDLVAIQRVLGSVALSGLDVSEEAIVEARRRYPDFRFKLDTSGLEKAWDVMIALEAPGNRARLIVELTRLASMSRRAVVAVFAHGALDATELPLTAGQHFVLAHAALVGDTQKWIVAMWALVELPQLDGLPLSVALPAVLDPEASGPRRPALDRLETELARVRARLADTNRELVATRALFADKQAELEHLAHEVDAVRAHDSEVQHELARMQSSKSWQVTRPMRSMVGNVRQVQDHAKDVLTLVRRLSKDVAAGRAREWVRLAGQRSQETKERKSELVRVVSTPVAVTKPLFQPTIFVFALVPFDDVGGGQRSAQLARVFAARGYQVVYVYLYKKWNVVKGAEEESEVDVPLITHLHIGEADPQTLLRNAAPSSVALFEAPHPRYEPFFERARQIGLRTVFELIDAWDTSLGGDWYKPELMRRFSTEADVAVGTARALVKQLERYGRSDVVYLPNAGNEAIFDGTRTYARPPEMDATRRAFVYVGSLYGEWFGWDHIRAAARACSDAIFYLIGDPPKGIEVPSNVRLLGPRKIDEVPAYLAAADAALLPFIPGRISDAVSPIKIFEYLLMGKQVVSTDLPEIRDYPNTTICDSVEGFARACRSLEPPAAAPERFIMKNTWSARADALLVPASLSRVSAIVLGGDESLFEAELCAESLAEHGLPHLAQVLWVAPESEVARVEALRRHLPMLQHVVADAPTIAAAWAALGSQVSSEVVLILDARHWLTSRAAIEEGLVLLASEASVGAVGVQGRFLDPDTGRADVSSAAWLNEQRGGGTGYRREVGYVAARGVFVRRRLLDRLTATPLESGELEGAELSFRVKASGLDVVGRALTGLRVSPETELVVPSESRDAFLEKWKSQRHFFITRRGA